ncbi:MAG: tRNA (adenosine(37)-N6)-threonylcarbamoyltransferase complex ATPase subunit type 1 TsaE [Chlamydiales bacterium]
MMKLFSPMSLSGLKRKLHSSEETYTLGREIGSRLPQESLLSFFGELGAGKTTLIKGVVAGVTGSSVGVESPTFTYLNIYGEKKKVFHFDLYRLRSPADFIQMGFEEYLVHEGVTCIEWSERIEQILPPHAMKIVLSYESENCRLIEVL